MLPNAAFGAQAKVAPDQITDKNRQQLQRIRERPRILLIPAPRISCRISMARAKRVLGD
jgi:hypothetical protein